MSMRSRTDSFAGGSSKRKGFITMKSDDKRTRRLSHFGTLDSPTSFSKKNSRFYEIDNKSDCSIESEN